MTMVVDTASSMAIGLTCLWLALILLVLLSALQDGRLWSLSNLGGKIMSVIDEAIARFTKFTQGVLGQLKGAKEANDTQTAKLVELQAALDAALGDDAADKAAIASLQAEVASLQDDVAAKINAAVDTLENPPVAEEVAPAPEQ